MILYSIEQDVAAFEKTSDTVCHANLVAKKILVHRVHMNMQVQ